MIQHMMIRSSFSVKRYVKHRFTEDVLPNPTCLLQLMRSALCGLLKVPEFGHSVLYFLSISIALPLCYRHRKAAVAENK